ncbi:MAG: DUF3325 family protein [Pseudomonadota bacterium]
MSALAATGLLVIAYSLCTIGCALLALSQSHHFRKVLDDRSAKPPKLARFGCALVLLSLIPCILRDGGSFAALLWPLVFASGALTIGMALAFMPYWLRPLAIVWIKKQKHS